MNRKFIAAACLLFTITSFSQQVAMQDEPYKRDIARNELSIGAFNLVAFGALDIAYERIVSPHSSWALEGFLLALDRENEDASSAYAKDASLTGKYKYFFGERTAWGFYVNGLAMLSTGTYDNYDDYYYSDIVYRPREEKRYTDFALGFGLGGKFVSKQGFFLDLGTGIGRNLFNNDAPTIVGQFNVNLGFRF